MDSIAVTAFAVTESCRSKEQSVPKAQGVVVNAVSIIGQSGTFRYIGEPVRIYKRLLMKEETENLQKIKMEKGARKKSTLPIKVAIEST